MERNTATTFNELLKGDRFYFSGDAKKIAYQVTKAKDVFNCEYNKVDDHGKKEWRFDKSAPADKPVIFLRHTIQVA